MLNNCCTYCFRRVIPILRFVSTKGIRPYGVVSSVESRPYDAISTVTTQPYDAVPTMRTRPYDANSTVRTQLYFVHSQKIKDLAFVRSTGRFHLIESSPFFCFSPYGKIWGVQHRRCTFVRRMTLFPLWGIDRMVVLFSLA